MKYLFKHLEKIKESIKDRELLLCLDFDGTLSPIVKRPDAARLPAKTKALLEKISGLRSIKSAIISGRALSDVQRRTGIKSIIYAGNHGLEISGPGIRLKVIKDSYKSRIAEIYATIKRDISIGGVIIENKKDTISVHFRMASPIMTGAIRKLLKNAVKPHLKEKKVQISEGKKVIEIKPRINWNKGKAVKWILNFYKKKLYLPLYIGDDTTDEDAFRVLKKNGLSVYVGGRTTKFSAGYFLYDTKEVYRFLSSVYKTKKLQSAIKR